MIATSELLNSNQWGKFASLIIYLNIFQILFFFNYY